MKRPLVNFGMLMIMAVAIMFAGTGASAQQRHGNNGRSYDGVQMRDWRRDHARGDRYLGRRHKKDAHGYRNYGQYRRTQVGNRRFRTTSTRTWYLRNGIRVYRRRMNN